MMLNFIQQKIYQCVCQYVNVHDDVCLCLCGRHGHCVRILLYVSVFSAWSNSCSVTSARSARPTVPTGTRYACRSHTLASRYTKLHLDIMPRCAQFTPSYVCLTHVSQLCRLALPIRRLSAITHLLIYYSVVRQCSIAFSPRSVNLWCGEPYW